MARCVVIWLALLVAHVRAETIALLPLDTEKRLEIYSQPVAAEIARALKAAGLDVVVVPAKGAVPANAQLIVDGTITRAKGKEVTIAISIRGPHDTAAIDNVPPQTAALTNIDKAAADVSALLVPLVQKHLAELAKAKPPDKPVVVESRPPTTAMAPAVLVAVGAPPGTNARLVRLRDALGGQAAGWAREQKREAKVVPMEQLRRDTAVKTLGDQHVDTGIAFEVLSFKVETEDGIPMARVRVRVRIASNAEVKFERIVRSDTIVGDKGMADDALAIRAAREVLAIANAHLRRTIVGWK
jgi:hypothetical protein